MAVPSVSRGTARTFNLARAIAFNTPFATVPAVVRIERWSAACTVELDKAGATGEGASTASTANGWSQSAAEQTASQAIASSRLAALDRPDGPPQPPRCLLVRQALEIAEHHGRAITLRQPLEFLVDQRAQVVGAFLLGRLRRTFGELLLVALSPCRGGMDVGRGAEGDPVEPATDRGSLVDRSGLAHQDQEGRLERVFHVVRVVEDPTADSQHHRPMPPHQRRERELGRIVATGRELLEELRIGQVRADANPEDHPDVSQDAITLARPLVAPHRPVLPPYRVAEREGSPVPDFPEDRLEAVIFSVRGCAACPAS